MKITFILPAPADTPAGGYKIVYEYANRLIADGYHVAIGFDCRRLGESHHLPEPLRKVAARLVGNRRCRAYPAWFPLDARVEKVPIYSVEDLPESDVYVATALGTASCCMSSPEKWMYLVQDFENWEQSTTDEDVYESYRRIPNRIVVSKWLYDIVVAHTTEGQTLWIPNGIDDHVFYQTTDIEARHPHSICMLYHTGAYKGSKYGIAAIQQLKEKYPDLRACLFGTPKRPESLPSWIEYKQNATQEELRALYNASAVTLLPTIDEGFGLTGLEGMICGSVLCATDFAGSREYVRPGENALISTARDVDGMVKNVERVFENAALRQKLSGNGVQMIRQFQWGRSVAEFEKMFDSVVHGTTVASMEAAREDANRLA